MPSSWIYISLCIFLFACICIDLAFSSSSTTVSYTDHCSSVVPQSNPTSRTHKDSIPYLSTSYIIGGDRLLGRKADNQGYHYVGKSLNLEFLPKYYETDANGIYKVEAILYNQAVYRGPLKWRRNYSDDESYYQKSKDQDLIKFLLEGFWSENSRKLCMVGSAYFKVEEGKIINLNAVFKLKYVSENNPTIYTSVVSGTLESTDSTNDPGYFDPFLIFSFPAFPNYNYSVVSKELDEMFSSDFEVPNNQSLNLQPASFCSVLTERPIFLDLEYAMECNESQHSSLCSPLGASEGSTRILPPFLSLVPIQCSEGKKKLRYLAKFQDTNLPDPSFGLDSTLVVEALWDDKTNQLFGVACRILNPAYHLGNPVGDCAIRLLLRNPSIWTIRDDAEIIGNFWSIATVENSGYFKKINLTSSDQIGVLAFPGLRYEYTELDKMKKSCPVKRPVKKGNRYPCANSYAMRFDMSVKNSKGDECGWGNAKPISVGATIFEVAFMAYEPATGFGASPLNISYKIRINPLPQVNISCLSRSLSLHRQVEIIAEGVYSAETGYLCMVGCRKLIPHRQNSSYISNDCEILVKFEFAPLDENRGGFIKGTIESTRAKSDPLYFEALSLSSSAYYPEVAERSIWRMDLEITMVLISNTLSCIFVWLQILHIKRNSEVSSCISLVMLLVLSLGNMIPLVLNSEALSLGNHKDQRQSLSNGGRLEANEVTVRLITMVALLLQLRLLQLVLTAKQNRQGNEKKWWIREKKTSFVSVSLCISGGMLTLILNWKRNSDGDYPIFSDLRSYAGLVLDGFLLPQILLNAFTGFTEKALCLPFYIGISAVRLVPHAYNQYRAHNYPTFDVKETYYYANPAADFYSTASDIVIPCGIVALGVIVFLQQRCGGCLCILPQRFRRLEMYEKVATVDNE